MTTQHTPGQWQVRASNYGLNIIAPTSVGNHVLIAQICETSIDVSDPERSPYDARLIAAAPELLESLDQMERAFCANSDIPNYQRAALERARAAIAKATGQI